MVLVKGRPWNTQVISSFREILQDNIERRLLIADEKVVDESHLTLVPTPEQSAELERLIDSNRRGELDMISSEKFLNSLRNHLPSLRTIH